MNDDNESRDAGSATEEVWPDKHITEFKVQLNNLVLMYGPRDLTLGQAEKAMVGFLRDINSAVDSEMER